MEDSGGDRGRRVVRGGSWNMKPENLRSAARAGNFADTRLGIISFRLAQDF